MKNLVSGLFFSRLSPLLSKPNYRNNVALPDVQKPDRESFEAINQTLTLSIAEIEEAFARGYVECTIEGETRHVNARDPFLAYALTMIKQRTKNAD